MKREDVQGELERLVAEEARTRFDLEAGPLIRGRLIRLGRRRACVADHHAPHCFRRVVDGGVDQRVECVVRGLWCEAKSDPLPELKMQYADYAVWQRKWIEGEILQRQAEYWKADVGGSSGAAGATGGPCAAGAAGLCGSVGGLVLDEELTAGLKDLSRRHGTTLYMTLAGGLGGAAGAACRGSRMW